MAIKCKNCGASIATDGDKLDLTRINALGEVGEWICRKCLDELLERTVAGEPVYMHHPDCPNYCDYACNSRKGEEIAEQIGVYLRRCPICGKTKCKKGMMELDGIVPMEAAKILHDL